MNKLFLLTVMVMIASCADTEADLSSGMSLVEQAVDPLNFFARDQVTNGDTYSATTHAHRIPVFNGDTTGAFPMKWNRHINSAEASDIEKCICYDDEKALLTINDNPNGGTGLLDDFWFISGRDHNNSTCTVSEDPASSYPTIVARRYNTTGSNGAYDTTWSTDAAGRELSVTGTYASATADNTQRLYISSTASVGGVASTLITRFTNTGSLDTTWGTSGVVTINTSTLAGITGIGAHQTTFQGGHGNLFANDSAVLWVGVPDSGGSGGFIVVRMNQSDGSFDTNFSTTGAHQFTDADLGMTAGDSKSTVADFDWKEAGKVVVAMRVDHDHNSSTQQRVMLVRTVNDSTSCTTSANCLDTQMGSTTSHSPFNGPGYIVLAHAAALTDATPLVLGVHSVTNEVAVLVQGTVSSLGQTWAYKTTQQGFLDTGFSSDGRVQVTIAESTSTLASDGEAAIEFGNSFSVFVAGYYSDAYPPHADNNNQAGYGGYVERFTSAGVKDTGFNTTGEIPVTYLTASMSNYGNNLTYNNDDSTTITNAQMQSFGNWILDSGDNPATCPLIL